MQQRDPEHESATSNAAYPVEVHRVDTWAATIKDRPGGLAEKLDAVAAAGADVQFIIARRTPEKDGQGVVFITPLIGPEQVKAAKEAGFEKSESMHTIRVDTENRPGFGASLTWMLADADINLRGLSAAVVEDRSVIYLAFDDSDDAARATQIIKSAGEPGPQ